MALTNSQQSTGWYCNGPDNGDKRPISGDRPSKPIASDGQPIAGNGWHWCLYIGLVFFATVAVGEEMTDEADCIVKHIEQNQTSAKYHFKEGELVLGFLPIESTDQALTGINFTIYQNFEEAILSANVLSLNSTFIACYENNELTESSKIKRFASNKYFEWQHIRMSVSNKSLIIDGTDVVCSKTLLDDKSSYITVTPTKDSIDLVHNCQEACPVFWNSISVKKTSFNVSVVNTTSVEREINMTHTNWFINVNNEIRIIPSSIDSFWHQLQVQRNHSHVILKVEDSTTQYFKVNNSNVILTGNSVAWVVNCDRGILKDTWKQYYSDINKDSGDSPSNKWLVRSIIIILMLLLIILVLWFRKLQQDYPEPPLQLLRI